MKYGFRHFYKRLRSFFGMIPVHRDNRFSCGRRGFLFASVRFSKSLLQGEGISGKHRFHQWWRFRHRARRQPREVPVLQRGRGAVLFHRVRCREIFVKFDSALFARREYGVLLFIFCPIRGGHYFSSGWKEEVCPDRSSMAESAAVRPPYMAPKREFPPRRLAPWYWQAASPAA